MGWVGWKGWKNGKFLFLFKQERQEYVMHFLFVACPVLFCVDWIRAKAYGVFFFFLSKQKTMFLFFYFFFIFYFISSIKHLNVLYSLCWILLRDILG